MNTVKKSSNSENKLCILYITMSSEQGVISGIKSLAENLPEYRRLGMVAEEFIPTVDLNKNFDFDQNNSVYITNINYNTERENMIDFFRAYLGTDMFILDMLADNNGSFSGQAFIYLASESDKFISKNQEDAAEPENCSMQRRDGELNKMTSDEVVTIRISGFSNKTRISAISDICSKAGLVKRIHKNNAGNKIFVDMEKDSDVDKLIKDINEITLDKRNLRASLVVQNIENTSRLETNYKVRQTNHQNYDSKNLDRGPRGNDF
ncbi:hypothetical protein AYI69_g10878, partial [Smittium culicis]